MGQGSRKETNNRHCSHTSPVFPDLSVLRQRAGGGGDEHGTSLQSSYVCVYSSRENKSLAVPELLVQVTPAIVVLPT